MSPTNEYHRPILHVLELIDTSVLCFLPLDSQTDYIQKRRLFAVSLITSVPMLVGFLEHADSFEDLGGKRLALVVKTS